ncbi:MAG: MFS transporter [Gammaproteobacteria bacterium]|nr:MFS transporter [Gammaproteobacteria bacterium]
MKGNSLFQRDTLSWAFYDWANSAFATTVVAGFFPLFFKEFWSLGVDATVSTFRLGVASSVSSLIIVVLAPILGAISDSAGIKKKLLAVFAFVGIVSTFCLFLAGNGMWELAIALYIVASLGFFGGNVFYDALLLTVAPTSERIHQVSGFGFALGYLGGGILFAVNVFMVLKPELFGLADSAQAVQISFITVAVWWAVFSIPIMLFVKEERVQAQGATSTIMSGIRQLAKTCRNLRTQRTILLFLIAYWFYIDGVDSVFRMAVDYGLSIGLASNDLITALLLVQFIGFPAAWAFGKLGQKIGPKPGIYIGIVVYLVATLWASFMTTGTEFYILAAMVGLVVGGIQALSRSLLGQLIPPEQAGEYYGFFNMVGKTAAVIGPFLVGWSALMFGSRLSIVSLSVLFLLGGIFLYFVKVPKDQTTEAHA